MSRQTYTEPGNLGRKLSFRLFIEQEKDMNKIVRYAVDIFGGPKFGSESHFIRCAVARLLSEELGKLEKARGRPRKGVVV